MPPSEPEPRFERRKPDRPAEIADAALEEFARHGYAGARVADVAKRAGISKGLMYVYFRTKEELFKAVVRSVVTPRLDHLADSIRRSRLTTEQFLRGPFLEFMQQLVRSRANVLMRLMIAEGPRHPDLTSWYADNVLSVGLAALRELIKRGVRSGELRPSAVHEFPQLLIAPVTLAIVWQTLFERHLPLDTDRMLEEHVDLLVRALAADGPRQQVLL